MRLDGKITHGMTMDVESAGAGSIEIGLGSGVSITLYQVKDMDMEIALGPIGSYVDMSKFYTKDEIDAMLADVGVQSDWSVTDVLSKAYIKNKPIIPTVPTNVSSFTNDAGYLTQHQDISGKQDVIEDLDSIRSGAARGATALQSYTETDPTVPSWAKQSTKPSYTASEVGALPNTTQIPTKTSDLTNDSGFITGFTETDPTVPSWAKQPTKPSYTASEVGALPSSTTIPTESTVSGWGFTKNAGTITGITMNGASKGTSGVVNLGTVLTEHQSLASLADGAEYDSAAKKIYLKHGTTRLSNPIDATAFIKDGMVDSVTISNGSLVITFTTDAGKQPISIPISDIFNANNYYTKSDIDNKGYLTSETDPIFSASAAHGITSADITNWNNKLDSYTETDPTVPSWAKQSTKPSYNYSEINNTPSLATVATSGSYNDLSNKPTIPTVPTNVSAFTNDAGYLTTHQDISGKQDVLTAGDGIAIDNTDTIRTVGIPYGKVDSTSTSTVFTATVPGIDRLEDGVCVLLKNGVVTSAAGFTININGLGAKPCYSNMAAATAETTLFDVKYTILFVYDSTRVSGGCWIYYRGYDSNTNTNTIGYQLRCNSTVQVASDTSRYYKIFFTSADGTKLVPASVNSTNNATSARPVNQRPINPFGRIAYTSANTNYTAGSNVAASSLWNQYPLVLGYSFNRTGADLTLTAKAPVYVKCAPQSDGSAIMDADVPLVQTLPSTADGKIYIFLGIAYDATHIELFINHPVYYHDGTGIRLWTGSTGGGIDTSSFVKKRISSTTHAVIIGDVSGEEITAIKLRSGIADNDDFDDGTIEFSDGVNAGVMLHAYNDNFYIEGTGGGELGDSTSYRFPAGVKGNVAVTKNYYTKTEIDTMIGDIETLLASI